MNTFNIKPQNMYINMATSQKAKHAVIVDKKV